MLAIALGDICTFDFKYVGEEDSVILEENSLEDMKNKCVINGIHMIGINTFDRTFIDHWLSHRIKITENEIEDTIIKILGMTPVQRHTLFRLNKQGFECRFNESITEILLSKEYISKLLPVKQPIVVTEAEKLLIDSIKVDSEFQEWLDTL
jgi:hypothetical protein